MTEFYLRRIDNNKRVRLRVTVKDSTITVLFVSYLKGKFHRPGTWSLDQKSYQFNGSDLPVDYLLLIDGYETCTKAEFRSAKTNAVKSKPLSYLLPADEVLNKIKIFMKK